MLASNKFAVIRFSILILFGTAVLAGCTSVRFQATHATREPAEISDRELNYHMQRVNRAAASHSDRALRHDELVAYLSARFRGFGLRPVFGESYRTRYYDPARQARETRIARGAGARGESWSGPGTLTAHGRSGPAVATIEQIVFGDSEVDDLPEDTAVLINSDQASALDVLTFVEGGASAVIIVGRERDSMRRIGFPETPVIYVNMSAAAELLGLPRSNINAFLRDAPASPVGLPVPVRIEVLHDFSTRSVSENVIGILTGKNPARSQELVVVAASMEAVTGSGIPERLVSSGEQLAAVMEAARQIAALSHFHAVPQVSIMFVLLSGSIDDQAGLRAFTDSLPWSTENIRYVVYTPAPHENRHDIEEIFSRRGLTVEFIQSAAEHDDAERGAREWSEALIDHLLRDEAINPDLEATSGRDIPDRETVPGIGPTVGSGNV